MEEMRGTKPKKIDIGKLIANLLVTVIVVVILFLHIYLLVIGPKVHRPIEVSRLTSCDGKLDLVLAQNVRFGLDAFSYVGYVVNKGAAYDGNKRLVLSVEPRDPVFITWNDEDTIQLGYNKVGYLSYRNINSIDSDLPLIDFEYEKMDVRKQFGKSGYYVVVKQCSGEIEGVKIK